MRGPDHLDALVRGTDSSESGPAMGEAAIGSRTVSAEVFRDAEIGAGCGDGVVGLAGLVWLVGEEYPRTTSTRTWAARLERTTVRVSAGGARVVGKIYYLT
ncbi:hypothetical protein [Homoserinimonas sp. OAct 916]|uniref:hypothetical protein n=1 Tax=Homoserinimonas sp. OAct 916 TaxID=2211450 RepID=UPI0013004E49|nr:hypothetical protein [Homoserinimonas sp. OAct 916]